MNRFILWLRYGVSELLLFIWECLILPIWKRHHYRKKFRTETEKRRYIQSVSDRYCRLQAYQEDKEKIETDRNIFQHVAELSEQTGIPQWEIRTYFEEKGIL